jgi:hypothetical protein
MIVAVATGHVCCPLTNDGLCRDDAVASFSTLLGYVFDGCCSNGPHAWSVRQCIATDHGDAQPWKCLTSDDKAVASYCHYVAQRPIRCVEVEGRTFAHTQAHTHTHELANTYIDKVFIDELNDVAENNTANPWLILSEEQLSIDAAAAKKPKTAATPKAKAAPAAEVKAVETIAEKKSLLVQLAKVGFVSGAALMKFKKKDEDPDNRVYAIARIDAGGAVIGAEGVAQEVVPLSLLNNVYKVTSKQEQVRIDNANPLAVDGWSDDVMRSALIMAVRCATAAHDNSADVVLYERPFEAAASKDYTVGALTLVPATNRISLRRPDDEAKAELGSSTDIPLQNGQIAKLKRRVDDSFRPAFWFVARGSSESDANMKITSLKKVTVWVGDAAITTVAIPVMKNVKKLKNGDKLVLPPLEDYQ